MFCLKKTFHFRDRDNSVHIVTSTHLTPLHSYQHCGYLSRFNLLLIILTVYTMTGERDIQPANKWDLYFSSPIMKTSLSSKIVNIFGSVDCKMRCKDTIQLQAKELVSLGCKVEVHLSSICFLWTARRHIAEERNLNSRAWRNYKPNISVVVLFLLLTRFEHHNSHSGVTS
jgi:hypothetical protein